MMIQIAAAFIGSLGFAVFLKMKGKQVLMAGVGGGLTWALFLALQNYMGGLFVPNLLASIFVGIYAEIMARVNRAPATIFLTTGAVPLIPGGSLYYTMLGLVSNDELMFAENGSKAAIIALAIALGFVIVAIANNLHLRVQKGQ
ncbi:MAG: threonine/serine exporter family protein [Firmicutes bacterium]|nr:threonine/serine exporter family protein [Bacillota bacterium]